MNIMIDGIDFWDDFKAEKYWSPTKNQNIKEITKNAIYSGAYCASEKIDGDWRMLIRDTEGNFHLRGRSESVNGGYADKIEWVPHITDELNNLPNGTVLLGEMYLDSQRGSRKVTTIMGCLKDKALERQEKGEKLSYYVFDILAWNGHNLCEKPLELRITALDYVKDYCSKYVSVSKYYIKPYLIEDLIASTLAADLEGVVLKRLDGKYEQGKRTARKSIKVKKEVANNIDCFTTGRYKPATIEYTGKEIQDWIYWQDLRTGAKYNCNMYNDYLETNTVVPITKGHYFGWAGAIELAVWRDGKELPIAWISNVTEEIKAGIVGAPEQWTHRVCEVQAMMIEQDTKALRHGKIMQWRDDKDWRDCDGHEIFG